MKKEVKETKKAKKIETAEEQASRTPEKVIEEDKTLDNDGKVGTMLRETRLKRGEEIEDVAKTLRIRTAYLSAIENSNYDEIPEAPYGQGFVRAYADYLGLNPVRIAQLFKEETDANSRKDDYFVLEPQAEATVPNRKYILISLAAIVLVYLGWILYSQNMSDADVAVETAVENSSPVDDFPLQVEDFGQGSGSSDEAPTVEAVSVSEAEAPLPVVEVAPQAAENMPQVVVTEGAYVESKPAAAKTEPKPETPKAVPAEIKTDAKVVVKIKKETWFEAKTPAKLYISKVVDDGFTYNVPEDAGMTISLGRFDAADVYVNGKLEPNVFTANKKTGISVDGLLNSANH